MNSLGLIPCQSVICFSVSCINPGTSRQIVGRRFSVPGESLSTNLPYIYHLYISYALAHRALLTVLGQKYDQYLDFAQQDAHEFLRILLDAMRMEELDVSFFPFSFRSLCRELPIFLFFLI